MKIKEDQYKEELRKKIAMQNTTMALNISTVFVDRTICNPIIAIILLQTFNVCVHKLLSFDRVH